MTSIEVANAIFIAIRWAGSLRVSAEYDDARKSRLTHDDEGASGNQLIVGAPQNRIYDILKISGMSGGVGRDCPQEIPCSGSDVCAPGLTCKGDSQGLPAVALSTWARTPAR